MYVPYTPTTHLDQTGHGCALPLNDDSVRFCILRSDYKFSSYYNQRCKLQVRHFLVSKTRDNALLISIYKFEAELTSCRVSDKVCDTTLTFVNR